MVGLDVGYLEKNLNKVKLQTKGKIINIQQKQLSKLKQINSAFGIFCKIIDFVVQKLRFFKSSSNIIYVLFEEIFKDNSRTRPNPDLGLNIFRSATTRTHSKQTERLSKQSRPFTEFLITDYVSGLFFGPNFERANSGSGGNSIMDNTLVNYCHKEKTSFPSLRIYFSKTL